MFKRHHFIFGLFMAVLVAALVLRHNRSERGPAALAEQAPQWHESADALATPVADVPEAPDIQEWREMDWESRWQSLAAEPQTTARDEDMVTLLEELAATNPTLALALASGESNSRLRGDFLQAAVRGWGMSDAAGAVAWARSQTLMDEGQALAAAFHGAVREPAKAIQLTEELSAKDPSRARAYGASLIGGLVRAGEFNDASAFASTASTRVRVDWLNTVYSRWADDRPSEALRELGQLESPETRRIAFDATVTRWAENDARAALEFTTTLPAGRDQGFALNATLRAWAASDVVGSATWLAANAPSPQLDFGSAMIALQPQTLSQPDIAMRWAMNIVDPQLRSRVLASVVNEWAAADSDGARRFANALPTSRSDEREAAQSGLAPDFAPISLLP